MLNFLRSRLSPFRHPSFRAFFLAQSLSLIGQMSHDLARSWIVVETMGRAASLGSLHMAIAIPSLLLILHGGVLVDRVDVRRLMMITKSLLAVAALAMALVVEFGSLKMWMLLVFGLIEGCVVAFDSPAFQAITVRLVPRDDFQQAIALNSTNFHSARMLGPIVAAGLMSTYGPALVFLFDAVTYLAIIFVLRGAKLREIPRHLKLNQSDRSALGEGFTYLFSQPWLRYMWLQLMLTICLVYPLMIVVFRTYLQKKFDLSAEQFGMAFSIPAFGSMMGALSFAAFKPKMPVRALKIGIPCAGIMLFLVPIAPTITLASLAMGFTGFFTYLSFASLTVSMHLTVEEAYRGRMSSLVAMGFVSIGPLMGFPIGYFADQVGFQTSVYIITGTFLLCSALLALYIAPKKGTYGARSDVPTGKSSSLLRSHTQSAIDEVHYRSDDH